MPSIGQTTLPENVNVAICNAQFSRVILEIIATVAGIVLLLSTFLFGAPSSPAPRFVIAGLRSLEFLKLVHLYWASQPCLKTKRPPTEAALRLTCFGLLFDRGSLLASGLLVRLGKEIRAARTIADPGHLFCRSLSWSSAAGLGQRSACGFSTRRPR